MENSPIKVFISYARKDQDYFEVFKDGLNSHLFNSSKYNFGTWEDSKIHLGSFWDDEIQKILETVDIAILCVSSNFLNSKYIQAKEFGNLISKYPNTLIVPVYFNHCNIGAWDELSKRQFFKPLGDRYDKATKEDFAFCDLIKFRETDGKPLSNSNIDLYFQDFLSKIEVALKSKEEENIDIAKSIKVEEQQKTNYSLVPRPTINFTGRRIELLSFREKFDKGNIFCIEGLGGTGKSEFITKFITDFSNDKIVWFDSKSDSSFESLIEGVGYYDLLKFETKDNLATFLGFRDLIERDEKLIIIDNYQDIKDGQFESFFKFLKNNLVKAKFILIDREKLLIDGIDIIHFPIAGLKLDSIEFAKKIISNNYSDSIVITDDKLLKICDDLHGHPFAIQLAIQLLSYESDDENILQIIKEYETESDKLSNKLLDEIFNHPKSTFEEKELLKKFSAYRGYVQKQAFEFIYELKYKEPLKKLINKLMITLDHGRYAAHPLVREFAYLKLDEKINVHKAALKYYLEIAKSNNDLSIQEEIFYHLQKAQDYAFGIEYFENNAERLISYGQCKFLKTCIEYLIDRGFKSQKLIIALVDTRVILEDSSIEVLEKLKEVFNLPTQSDEILLEARITETEILVHLGNLNNPKEKFEELIKDCQEINFIKGISICLSNISRYYSDWEKLDLAESKSLEALKVLKNLSYYAGTRVALNNLGYIYYKSKKYTKADNIFLQMLSNAEELGNLRDIIIAKNGLALVYTGKKEYSKALDILYANLRSSLEVGDKGNQATNYFNIANILLEQNDNSFLDYINRAYDIQKVLNNFSGISNCLEVLGIYYFKNEKYQQSINYFIQVVAYENKIKISTDKTLINLRNVKKTLDNESYSNLLKESFNLLEDELKKFVNIDELLFQPVINEKLPGRNESCYCGSGKKYKNCHGKAQ
jgi:tetratricopeptide (TPR) repeat protein